MKEASHKRPHIVRSNLYGMSRIGKSKETESRLVGAGEWGTTATEYRVSCWGVENTLKLHGGDGCTTL